jgi:hypothetical protein
MRDKFEEKNLEFYIIVIKIFFFKFHILKYCVYFFDQLCFLSFLKKIF